MRQIILCLLMCSVVLTTRADDAPPVMLAKVYHAGDPIELSDYWISEKYDGVRAWWDGEKLLSRGGTQLAAPAWFTEGWPRVPLDGELWGGRGEFEFTSGTVRKKLADDAAWRRLHYLVFDLPTQGGTFDQRLAALRALLLKHPATQLLLVDQFKLANAKALQMRLDQVVAAGGEGLMLHRGASLYRAERNGDLLKFKPYEDAEATVTGHLPGKGKYEGLLGALIVRRADGLQFRVGTGFSDAQRRSPPAVGSTITYAYNGFTSAGIPRFARFIRIREAP